MHRFRWFAAVCLLAFVPAGPALAVDRALTQRNSDTVRSFYTDVFIARNVDPTPRYMWPSYIQHNPQVPTGMKGFMDTFRKVFAMKLAKDYSREIVRIVAEDDFVVLYDRRSWTKKDGSHGERYGFEMFRLANGKIAEHWDADA